LSNIQRLVFVARNFALQPPENPTRIALGSEENRAMVAVNSMDLETLTGEEKRNLGAN
jgi:hypothetical protein